MTQITNTNIIPKEYNYYKQTLLLLYVFMVAIDRASLLKRAAIAAIASIVSASSSNAANQDPLLLRAARGEVVERPPVWMMRQAGRHMVAYRQLVDTYPTFRQRSEVPEVALQISLQPYEAYKVDGVIVFSDILTPLPEMGIDFDIGDSGKISIQPIRTQQAFHKRLKRTTDYNHCAVGQVLRGIRQRVQNKATVLGFIGLPYTIATYLVEGKTASASGFQEMTKLQQSIDDDGEASWLHSMLELLADNLADYACFQIDSGAQVLQVFDSWAGHLNTADYTKFALPYQQRVISRIKTKHPNTPIIIYMAPAKYSQNGQRLQQLAQSGADIVSVDHTVDMEQARRILQSNDSIQALQGNLDPRLLRDGSLEDIQKATHKMIAQAKGMGHIVNLGHGILPDTSEEKAAFFVKTVQEYKYEM
jgi:uroporphyrinogen decarboxylase